MPKINHVGFLWSDEEKIFYTFSVKENQLPAFFKIVDEIDTATNAIELPLIGWPKARAMH